MCFFVYNIFNLWVGLKTPRAVSSGTYMDGIGILQKSLGTPAAPKGTASIGALLIALIQAVFMPL
jgi:hypothetical protein